MGPEGIQLIALSTVMTPVGLPGQAHRKNSVHTTVQARMHETE